ncbi:MAG: alpha/beta hydrolase [Candidatus Neomarinimicrobiota bacterium]
MKENFRLYGQSPYNIAVLHGGPGAPGEMAPVAHKLARTCGVLEPLQTADSVTGQVAELHAVLSKNASLPVTLVGFSWGAWLAIFLTARYPTLVKNLILLGCPPLEPHHTVGINDTRLKRLNRNERTMLDSAFQIINDPSTQNKSEIFGRISTLLTKADTFDPLESEPDAIEFQAEIYRKVWTEAAQLRQTGQLLAEVRRITCPVTAIHGDYDPHPADAIRLTFPHLLNDFHFVLLERCGHRPWLEKQACDRFFDILITEITV